MSSSDSGVEFVLERVFSAPRELVFKTMIETVHLQKWWGPQGCAIDVLRHDAQPGGVFHYCMRFAPGVEMYGKFTYREVTAPERIVFTNGFADAQGNMIRNTFSPTWPLQTLNTVTLSEQDGQTRLTLHATPVDASELELDTFKTGHESLQQGFGGMYDVYEKYLATLEK